MRSPVSKRIGMLLYEDTPRYDWWLKLLFGGVVVLTLAGGIALLPQEPVDALVLLGTAVFEAVLFLAIMPRRFQVFQDRFKIVLGGPFAITIALSNLKEMRLAGGAKAFAYGGVRFATSTRGIVEVVPRRGLGIVISPAHPDILVQQVNQLLAEHRR